jgi:hypothetical protein
MQFKVISAKLEAGLKRQVLATFSIVLALMTVALPAYSLELGVKYQQGDMRYTRGYSIEVNDNFVRRGSLYWTVAYNDLDKVFIKWNNRYLDFPMQSAEAALSYRWRLRGQKYRHMGIELQVGGAVSLTSNKFFWPELNEERFFSETGDVSGFVSFSALYKVTPEVSLQGGLKHFPSYFEFGELTAGFVGLSYRFGGR